MILRAHPLPALHCYVLHAKHFACGLCASGTGNTHDLLNKGGESMSNCRFKLKALVGHSKAGQKVTYGAIKGAKFKQLALVHALSLPCCAPWHTCCNTRLAHISHSLCTGSTSCLCTLYNVVRVFSHCSLDGCRFDSMSSDELCMVLDSVCTTFALPGQLALLHRCHPACWHHLKLCCMVYRLSEGHAWLHHLRHHHLPRPPPGSRNRKLSASSSSEVLPYMRSLTLLQSKYNLSVVFFLRFCTTCWAASTCIVPSGNTHW